MVSVELDFDDEVLEIFDVSGEVLFGIIRLLLVVFYFLKIEVEWDYILCVDVSDEEDGVMLGFYYFVFLSIVFCMDVMDDLNFE